MNLKNYSSLPNTEIRILFYLLLVANDITKFNLPKLKEFINIGKKDNKTLFNSLRVLTDLGLIDFIFDENEVILYLQVFNITIDLQLYEWKIETIIELNKYLFLNNPGIMTVFVNHLYRPLGKYDEATMGEFFNPAIPIKEVDVPDKEEIEKVKRSERQSQRRLQDEKARTLTEKFYDHLRRNIPITLTNKLRNIEEKNALEFCKQYPEFPMEYVEEGIIWFLRHDFWKGIIVSISLLRKHFPKFLAQKGVKKTRPNKMKIL